MEEETDEYGPKTVFTIKHSEIPKGRTQCVSHSWRKQGENELYCPTCQSAIIVEEKDLAKMLNTL